MILKNSIIFSLCSITLCLFSTSVINAQQVSNTDRIAIERTFIQLATALDSQNANTILGIASDNSFEYFETLKRLALFAEMRELLSYDYHFVIPAIMNRSFYSYTELSNTTSKKLLLDNYVGFRLNTSMNIKEFIGNGPRRQIAVLVDGSGRPGPLIAFIKEGNNWKFDIEDTLRLQYMVRLNNDLDIAERNQWDNERFVRYVINKSSLQFRGDIFTPLIQTRR